MLKTNDCVLINMFKPQEHKQNANQHEYSDNFCAVSYNFL
jgi:hypothetical protein